MKKGSGTVQETLCDDLIEETLSRLPVKSILRSRSVSKAWLSMISDPSFKRLHHQHSQKKRAILSNALHHENCSYVLEKSKSGVADVHIYSEADECLEEDEFVFSHCYKADTFDMISSNGGSLLCYLTVDDILVCNPSTHELLTLPRGTRSNVIEPEFRRSSTYDLPHEGMIGFSYLHAKNEYKVVRLFFKRLHRTLHVYEYEMGVEILTLRDGEGIGDGWRQLEDEVCPYPVYCSNPPVVKDKIHWFVDDYYLEVVQPPDVHKDKIVSFDVVTEKFNVMSLPRDMILDDQTKDVVEFNGFLAVVIANAIDVTMEIWVLKEYEKMVWVKEYVIDVKKMDNLHCAGLQIMMYPYYVSDEEMLIGCTHQWFILYNIATHSSKVLVSWDNWKLGKRRCCCNRTSLLRLAFYQEGLFSFKKKAGCVK